MRKQGKIGKRVWWFGWWKSQGSLGMTGNLANAKTERNIFFRFGKHGFALSLTHNHFEGK